MVKDSDAFTEVDRKRLRELTAVVQWTGKLLTMMYHFQLVSFWHLCAVNSDLNSWRYNPFQLKQITYRRDSY